MFFISHYLTLIWLVTNSINFPPNWMCFVIMVVGEYLSFLIWPMSFPSYFLPSPVQFKSTSDRAALMGTWHPAPTTTWSPFSRYKNLSVDPAKLHEYFIQISVRICISIKLCMCKYFRLEKIQARYKYSRIH